MKNCDRCGSTISVWQTSYRVEGESLCKDCFSGEGPGEVVETEGQPSTQPQGNTTGVFVKGAGFTIIAVGVIASMVLFGEASSTYGGTDFLLQAYGVATLISSTLSGILFIALGEIISLLDEEQ